MHVKTSENATVSAIYTPFRLNFDFFNVHSFFYTLGYMLCIEIYVRLTGSTRRRYNFFLNHHLLKKRKIDREKGKEEEEEREGGRKNTSVFPTAVSRIRRSLPYIVPYRHIARPRGKRPLGRTQRGREIHKQTSWPRLVGSRRKKQQQ